ncbi:MAG: alkaline phosphatase D family protein [Lunatimonas sp.]|uniref:alkaline phosphatase D family protein n=1 Tax=Lunatimonas sp. TaxID=2060141 RepID=UPI00263B2DB9|nr:alkaline phosphatase D family protein [Lunatimonas sp.]MCC5937180.1 alkaline phosphatase D family protein [Lunatimonas sp.]
MAKFPRRIFFRKAGWGVLSFSFLPQLPLFARIRRVFLPHPEQERVFFTTGFKISEVTENSAMVWTRLCRQEHPNPVRHEREEKVFRHPIDFDEEQPVEQMDGGVESGPGFVRVKVYTGTEKIVSPWVQVFQRDDFTARIPLEGLKPSTSYRVELIGKPSVDGPTTVEQATFSTSPSPDTAVPVLLTTSTCQYFWSFDEPSRGFRTYDSMRTLKPDFFIQTGDYVYYDKPGPLAKDLEKARHKWRAMDAWPSLKDLYRETPIYMLKDDHDLLKDDVHPASSPYGKLSYMEGLKLWYENVPITGKPYRTFRKGKDLQIWLVEGREYRSPNDSPDGPGKTIWGKEQIAWFKRTVEESDATFKLLFTATPVVGPDRENKMDNHANKVYENEGNWLRQYLSGIDHLYVVNGDRHWQYVSKDESTGLLEFGSGPISDYHAQGWDPNDKRPEHRFLRVKGGFLSIQVDRSSGVPAIRFTHRDVDGNPTHEEYFTKHS